MNIKIPYSWLTEFVKTDIEPDNLAKNLSLCSASVERIEKQGTDRIFDIEITTNRIDMMSVYGLARETNAVLPIFGIKSSLNPYPESAKLQKSKNVPYLKVKIMDETLCPRFCAILIRNVTVKKSPSNIISRLEKAGVRSLNNLIDITNYCMYELGQPMHVFDYDKIGRQTMILRESRTGEAITTLDGINRKLPPGTIIIEDGSGKIIDLCGIMGGENSAVSENTKNVLLFVQTYDPVRIRRTCQELSFRTDAAVRFEKGVDKENVFRALERAVKLFTDHAKGKPESAAVDLYPYPFKEKIVSLKESDIKKVLGIEIKKDTVTAILNSLGFTVKFQNEKYLVNVPSFRSDDIDIPEDLIEEIARIYGYFNIKSSLLPGEPPDLQEDRELKWEYYLKKALKYWGFYETYTFSLVPQNFIPENEPEVLRLVNPLTRENEYLRTSLLPSLLKVISKNEAVKSSVKLFEISMTYKKNGNGKLPDEEPKLAIVIKGGNYYDIKGLVEQIFRDLGRTDFSVEKIPTENNPALFDRQKSAKLPQGIGIIGEISRKSRDLLSLKDPVAAAEIDCKILFSLATTKRSYHPALPFQAVIEDLTVDASGDKTYTSIIETIKSASPFVTKIELIDRYQDNLTLRLYFQSPEKTLTDEEVKKERGKILKNLSDFDIK